MELSKATRADIVATARDLRVINGMGEGAEPILFSLVLRALEREYPYGPIGDAIREEAKHKPHTVPWCKARDAVTTEAMELADLIRAENERTQAKEKTDE